MRLRSRLTRRTTAGRLAPALLALLLCTAGGALAQTPASGLSAAGVSPTRATANSIYNFSVEWTKPQLPFAGRFITMQEPRLVKVAPDGKSVQFRLPQFGGVDDHHEVWTAGGYAFEPLRKKRKEDATRAADELGELQPLDTQRDRLTDQGKFDDPKVEDWRTVKLPDDASASDREIEVLGYFAKAEPPAGEPPSATLQLTVTLGDGDGVWLNSLAAKGESIADDTVHATNKGTITLKATDPALANGQLVWVRAHFGTQDSPWLIEGWFPVAVEAGVASVNLFAGASVLGVFEEKPDSAENPDFGPTAAALETVTGLITLTSDEEEPTYPENAWVWLKLARQFQFDPARPSVTLRVAATPVVEKLTAGLYWNDLNGSENEDVP